MAEISRDEFARSIGFNEAPTAVVAPPEPISLAPATSAALNEQTRKLQLSQSVTQPAEPQSKLQSPDFATRLGARPGVPFDSKSGISFMSRLRAAAQPTPAEEEKALKSAYGEDKVRRNSFGWLVVTKPGADGKEQDVLVDPIGVDFGDVAGVIGELPEIVGAIAAALKTRGASMAPGIISAAKTLLATVAGSAAGGATKDILVRAAEGEPIKPGEIAARRGERAAVEMAAGTAFGTVAKGVGMFISPFSNTGPLQFEAKKAQDYFAKKYGVKLEMSPAESTGNSFLQRAEAMESQKPGASVPFEAMTKRRDAQIADLQRLALGGAVPDEEAAGNRALAALGAKTAPLEQDVQRAAVSAVTSAEKELTSGVGPQIDKTALGASIRARAEVIRTEYRTERDRLYNEVYSDPRTQVKNIAGDPLAVEADRMVGTLPKVQQAAPSPIVGAPAGTVDEVMTEFVEPGVLPKLRALQKAKGQKFRLDELQQMRTAVDNDIAQGEAIPGVQTRQLTQIRNLLTDRIKNGLYSLDKTLLKKWEAANNYVAKETEKFKRAGIAELFKDPEQASYLGETEIVARVTRGGTAAQDAYAAYKQFFGANSPEMSGVRQAIRDDVLGQDRIEGFVNAKGFINRITKLAEDAPAAFDDAFGSQNAANLRNSARALVAAQGSTLPEAELIKAVNSGNLSGQKLQQMISSQATKDAAYRNEIVKAVSEGNIKPDKIKPTEFVNRLVFKSDTQPQDVQGVMALLQDRPDVLEDIRRLTFKKALDSATAVTPATGKRIVVANDLEQMLSDPQMVKRLQSTLGSSTFEDLRQLTAFLKPGSVVQQAAKSAGGMSTGSQVAGLVERGALKYVDRAIKNFFIATAYTSPPVRALLTNTALETQGKANLVNYVVASTPFINAMIKDFGEGGARKAMAQLKGSVDRTVQEDPSQAELPQSREEFMQSIGAASDLNAPR